MNRHVIEVACVGATRSFHLDDCIMTVKLLRPFFSDQNFTRIQPTKQLTTYVAKSKEIQMSAVDLALMLFIWPFVLVAFLKESHQVLHTRIGFVFPVCSSI